MSVVYVCTARTYVSHSHASENLELLENVNRIWKRGRNLNNIKLLWFITIGFCMGIVKARQALIYVTLPV